METQAEQADLTQLPLYVVPGFGMGHHGKVEGISFDKNTGRCHVSVEGIEGTFECSEQDAEEYRDPTRGYVYYTSRDGYDLQPRPDILWPFMYEVPLKCEISPAELHGKPMDRRRVFAVDLWQGTAYLQVGCGILKTTEEHWKQNTIDTRTGEEKYGPTHVVQIYACYDNVMKIGGNGKGLWLLSGLAAQKHDEDSNNE